MGCFFTTGAFGIGLGGLTGWSLGIWLAALLLGTAAGSGIAAGIGAGTGAVSVMIAGGAATGAAALLAGSTATGAGWTPADNAAEPGAALALRLSVDAARWLQNQPPAAIASAKNNAPAASHITLDDAFLTGGSTGRALRGTAAFGGSSN